MSSQVSSTKAFLVKILIQVLLTTSVLLDSSSTTSSSLDLNDKNAFDHDSHSGPMMPPSFTQNVGLSMMDHFSPAMAGMMMPLTGPIMPPFMPTGMMGGLLPPLLGMGAGMLGGIPPLTSPVNPLIPPMLPHAHSELMMTSMHAPTHSPASPVHPRQLGSQILGTTPPFRYPHTHSGVGFSHPYPSVHHGLYDPLMDPGMLGSGNSFPGIPLKDSPKCRVTCDRVCDPLTGCTSNCMRQCCTFEKISTPLQSDLPQHPSGVNLPPTYDNIHPQFDPHHVPLHGLHGPHPHLHGGFRGYPIVRRHDGRDEVSEDKENKECQN
jgi:hypothetical protein